MPFRPWGFSGEPRRRPGLVGILWGRGHAAQRGSPAARSAWATPTARCAGQDLIAVRGSVLPGMPDIQTNVSTRSPRCCLARASGEESTHQPLPLTPGSTRNTSLPPTQAPTTAGDRGGDVTDGQDAPNDAEYARSVDGSFAVAQRHRMTRYGVRVSLRDEDSYRAATARRYAPRWRDPSLPAGSTRLPHWAGRWRQASASSPSSPRLIRPIMSAQVIELQVPTMHAYV
jgi:hypothetical protein